MLRPLEAASLDARGCRASKNLRCKCNCAHLLVEMRKKQPQSEAWVSGRELFFDGHKGGRRIGLQRIWWRDPRSRTFSLRLSAVEHWGGGSASQKQRIDYESDDQEEVDSARSSARMGSSASEGARRFAPGSRDAMLACPAFIGGVWFGSVRVLARLSMLRGSREKLPARLYRLDDEGAITYGGATYLQNTLLKDFFSPACFLFCFYFIF
eukprot:gene6303-4536_t